jgi:hypothetical protein
MEVTWTSVQVPAHAGDSFEVYLNGVRQREGSDFTRRGDELVFDRPLAEEGRLGFWRWLSLFLGIAGTYRKHDSVDIVYEVDGRRTVETGLPILQSGPMSGEDR